MAEKTAYVKGLTGSNRFMVAGNHKLFLPGRAQTREVVGAVARGVVKEKLFGVAVGIAPAGTWLADAAETASGVSGNTVVLISQTVGEAPDGAWTTAVSPLSVREAGARVTLLNHAEQRNMFGGITPNLNLRIMAAVRQGLDVILCIGEPKQHAGVSVEAIYEAQLMAALRGVPAENVLGRVVLALEPGQLIGEEIATLPVREIEAGVKIMFDVLTRKFPQLTGLPYIYGGGVSSDNVEGLLHHFRADERFVGTLPGTASKDAEEFLGVIRNTHRIVVSESVAKSFFAQVLPEAVSAEPARITVVGPALDRGAAAETQKPVFGRTQSLAEIAAAMQDRPVRIGLMGFGEVGRAAIEAAAGLDFPVDVVGVCNRDLSTTDAEGRAWKFEFLPGWAEFRAENGAQGARFVISGRGIRTQAYSFLSVSGKDITPAAEFFAGLRADAVVISASQLMNDRSTVDPFLAHGAKLVMLTSMSAVDHLTCVPGVNDDTFQPGTHRIMALGSCTGNAETTLAAAMEGFFGAGSIKGALVVTPHSVTPSQVLTAKGMDAKAETAMGNVVRTATGLSKLFAKPGFFPAAAGSLAAVSYRVPSEFTSALETYFIIEGARPGQENELRNYLREAARSARFAGMLLALDRTRGTRYSRNTFSHMVEVYLDSIKVMPIATADATRRMVDALVASIGKGILPESEEARLALQLQAQFGNDLGIIQVGATFGNVPGYAGNIIRGALFHGYKMRQAGLLV